MNPERLLHCPSFRMCLWTTLILSISTRCWPFDIYLDEKVQLKIRPTGYHILWFGEYRTIQDYLFVSRATYLMFVNVNEATSLQWNLPVMTRIYPNLTVHGSILSSFLFKRRGNWIYSCLSICVLAERYGVKGQTLRKQYKEKISDYRNWDQLEHAHDYLLYPQTLENLSLDETHWAMECLYSSDNKAAKRP